MYDLVINGKFLTRPRRGVGRFALEVLDALIDQSDDTGHFNVRIAVPRPALYDAHTIPEKVQACIEWVGTAPWVKSFDSLWMAYWEQVVLPRFANGRCLFSPCNSGPMSYSNQIVVIHDAQTLSPKTRGAYRWQLRVWYRILHRVLGARTRLCTVSKAAQQAIAQAGIAKAEDISVIYGGSCHIKRAYQADIANNNDDKWRAWTPYVLFVAPLTLHKNPDLALQAALGARINLIMVTGARGRQLRYKKYKSLVTYDAENAPLPAAVSPNNTIPFLRNALPRSDASKVNSSRILVLESVSDTDLVHLYRSAQALLCPFQSEGFGLPALEAMALGCPVIAAPQGALPEIGSSAMCYVPLEPPDRAAEKWAAALQRFHQSDIWHKHSTCGSAQASKFTWISTAQRLLDVLEDHQRRKHPTNSDGWFATLGAMVHALRAPNTAKSA